MKLLILHNIATSYYKNIVFNALSKKYKDFKVVHLGEIQSNRDWKIDLSYLKYDYQVMFKGNIDNVSKIKILFKVIKTLRMENYDLIYLGGYSEFAYWIALIYAKMKRKKIIIEMDSNKYNLGKKRFYKEFVKKIFVKLCDYGITYGSLSKDYLISLGIKENNIVIKPNVTDNDFWYKESENLKNKREEIIKKNRFKKYNFIYVGRFSKEKNLFFLLDCFSKIKNKTKDKLWGLILVGGGPLEEDLKKHVIKEKIVDVFFITFKQKNELPEYYAISDVLILPSLSETWGIVVNESMASGLVPMISNRCGASDLIDEGNGYLFDPEDENDLSNKMLNIIEDSLKLNLMKKNNKTKIKSFTSGFAADKIIELINKIEKEEKDK